MSAERAVTEELSLELSLFHIVMMGLGMMIGAGVFVGMGICMGLVGPGGLLLSNLGCGRWSRACRCRSKWPGAARDRLPWCVPAAASGVGFVGGFDAGGEIDDAAEKE